MGKKVYVGNLSYAVTDATLLEAAIQALDGKDVDGRSLTPNEARPRPEGGGGRGGYAGGRGGGRRC